MQKRHLRRDVEQGIGHVAIDGPTQVMTVSLKDLTDTTLWSVKLDPKTA